MARSSSLVVFHGMCDASGAVVLNEQLFAVADDEDNVLRVYDGRTGGFPLYQVDVSPALMLEKPGQETDIEAGTRTDTLAFWITSHGRNSKGKPKPSRFRLFATTVPAQGTGIQIVGQPYLQILQGLIATPELAPFELDIAATKAPKEPGGLAIEGMTAIPGSSGVLIGFRNPVPQGKALVVTLHNPEDVVRGGRARFGNSMLLDLGGLGVRSLSWWRGRYLIIAGAIASGSASRLFTWDGKSSTPEPVLIPELETLNPEAFATYEDKDEILLLSDDGDIEIEGKRCKSLKDPAKKQFRGLWLALPPSSAPAGQ